MSALGFKRGVFAAACVAVVVLSLVPGEAIPKPFQFWDKAQHALGFAGLAVLAAWARVSAQAWRWGLGLLVLGAAIEVAQSFVPWRFGDVADWLADAVGVGLVVLVLRLRPRRPTTA